MTQALRRVPSPAGELIIRRYEERDIPYHQAYVYDSPVEFLEGIGFDTAQRKPRDEFAAFIRGRIAETLGTNRPNALVAELEGRAIAVVPLDLRNDIDHLPRLHFHIFEPGLRGRGMGQVIFRACAEEHGKITGFARFLIEPKASNGPMNALMRKLGFGYIKDYEMPPRPGIQKMIVSQYEILLPFSP